MAFRVVRLRKEARRNAKLEEIFTVRNGWEEEEEENTFELFRRKTRTKAEQSTWIILLRYSACMR